MHLELHHTEDTQQGAGEGRVAYLSVGSGSSLGAGQVYVVLPASPRATADMGGMSTTAGMGGLPLQLSTRLSGAAGPRSALGERFVHGHMGRMNGRMGCAIA